jgi:hypothetical protein
MKPLLHLTGEVPMGIESGFRLDFYVLIAKKVFFRIANHVQKVIH